MSLGQALFSSRIDEGLQVLFAAQLETAVNGFENGYAEALKPEIQLAIGVVYYALGFLWQRRRGGGSETSQGTAGMRHFQLVSHAVQRGTAAPALPLVLMLLVYTYKRIKRTALVERWHQSAERSLGRRLHSKLGALDIAVKILTLGNCISYLSAGTYPDLLYSLSLFSIGASSSSSSQSGTTPLQPSPGLHPLLLVKHHHLLWGTLQACLRIGILGRSQAILLMRHASWQVSALRRALVRWGPMRWLPRLPLYNSSASVSSSLSSFSDSTRDGDSINSRSNSSSNSNHNSNHGRDGLLSCVICTATPPEAPHAPECGHPCCYFCLKRALAAQSRLQSSQRLEGGRENRRGEVRNVEGEGEGEGEDDGNAVGRLYFLCPECGRAATVCRRWEPQSLHIIHQQDNSPGRSPSSGSGSSSNRRRASAKAQDIIRTLQTSM